MDRFTDLERGRDPNDPEVETLKAGQQTEIAQQEKGAFEVRSFQRHFGSHEIIDWGDDGEPKYTIGPHCKFNAAQ